MRSPSYPVIAIFVLIALRVIAGAFLPLSADESYYWLWSRHLAAGYFDDPPAIAFAVRIGTAIFGDTSFGVRFVPLLCSLAASWATWRAGAVLLRDEKAGLQACLLFSATLMVAVESMAATMDALVLACAALFLLTLAKFEETRDGRWWLAVGAAAGLGLLSKYTFFFLGFGALVWLIVTPSLRRWLWSPWPYLGGALALIIFVPNLWWNATHHWLTFGLEYGRVVAGRPTLRFLIEFLAAEFGLATPLIFVLGVMGIGLATRAWRAEPALALIAALAWPAIVYFAYHSLHDRVQGNWPSFLMPAFAVAAVAATRHAGWTGWRAGLARFSARFAAPLALVLLTAVYLQAFFGLAPLGRKDPSTRLAGFGIADVAAQVDAVRISQHASAILTTHYETTGWFAFYAPVTVVTRSRAPLIQIGDDNRWLSSPVPSPALLQGPLIYVTEDTTDLHGVIAQAFSSVTEIARIDRKRGGVVVAHYVVYRVGRWRGATLGRQPL
jgi:4-amino-4-deoxy-L-arabinose transferase-like glycosyltransferase